MSSPSRQSLFSEATRPVKDVERVSGLEYTHPIMLPEDVQAGFEIASPITRAMALLLDLVFSCVVTLCVVLGFAAMIVIGGGWAQALIILAVAIIQVGYFFFFEGFMAGQTPGKQIMGLRVINQDGEDLSPRQGMVRSLIRLVEIGPLPIVLVYAAFDTDVLYSLLPLMVLWVLVFVDSKHRRVGDFMAGTLVIRQRVPTWHGETAHIPGYFELGEHFFPISSKELGKLSAGDYVRLEDFGQRIRTIRPPLREQVAMVAAYALAKKIGYSRPVYPKQAERFLFEVHAAIKEQMRQLYPDLYR